METVKSFLKESEIIAIFQRKREMMFSKGNGLRALKGLFVYFSMYFLNEVH